MRRFVLAPFLAALLATACMAAVPLVPVAAEASAIEQLSVEADGHQRARRSREWAEALARRAQAYQSAGHRLQALTDLRQAAAILEGDGASSLRAAVLGALAQANLLAGRHDEALARFDVALEVARDAQDRRVAAAIRNDQGSLLAVLGRHREALAAFEMAAAQAVEAADRDLAGRAKLNAARVHRRLGEAGHAATLARESAAQLAAAARVPGQPLQLALAGTLLRELASEARDPGLAANALATLTAAVSAATDAGDERALAQAWGALAELYLDDGRLRDAMGLNERALFHAQAGDSPEALFFAQWQAARLLEHAQRGDEALAAYRRALEALGRVKADIAADLWAGRESFTERIGQAYLGLASLLLKRATAMGDPVAKRLALQETRATLEGLRQVELEDYFRDDCVARYLARARGIEQIAARTAVLYPVALADRLELVVSIGDELHQISVPVGEDVVGREARTLRTLLEKRTTYQYLSHARRLYDWLVRPLEPLLSRAGVDTIVLIPDRFLRAIPLAALHDGREFLIARYAVAVAPSLSLVEPRRVALESAPVLATGLTESVQGFSALPFVQDELDQLGTLRLGALLRDRAFTTENLERELRNRAYSVVHIASHAQFEADSRRSFVLTYDGRFTIDRLEGELKASRFRDDPVELLFLSACQTATGDERAALGLAGVAVKAGARSALATLWHINDQASSLLVTEFYRLYRDGTLSKAQALRRAQLALLADLRYRHPGYWSAFLMIGNWL